MPRLSLQLILVLSRSREVTKMIEFYFYIQALSAKEGLEEGKRKRSTLVGFEPGALGLQSNAYPLGHKLLTKAWQRGNWES